MGRFVFALVALGLGLTLIFGYPFENGLLKENSSTERVEPDLTRLKSIPAGAIDGERIIDADLEPGSWSLTLERTTSKDLVRSPSKRDNAVQLGLAWYFETGTTV